MKIRKGGAIFLDLETRRIRNIIKCREKIKKSSNSSLELAFEFLKRFGFVRTVDPTKEREFLLSAVHYLEKSEDETAQKYIPDIFSKIASLDSKRGDLCSAARYYEKGGEYDKAKKIYEEMLLSVEEGGFFKNKLLKNGKEALEHVKYINEKILDMGNKTKDN